MSHLVELYPDGNGMNEQGDVVSQVDYQDADGDVVAIRDIEPALIDADKEKRDRWDQAYDDVFEKAGSADEARRYVDALLGYSRPPELAPKQHPYDGHLAVVAMNSATLEHNIENAAKNITDVEERRKIAVEYRAKDRARREIRDRGY